MPTLVSMHICLEFSAFGILQNVRLVISILLIISESDVRGHTSSASCFPKVIQCHQRILDC